MRRFVLFASIASISVSVAQAATPAAYFVKVKVPIASVSGVPGIIGATELTVILYSSTPFKKNACTAASLYDFNDGADTPQTIVYNNGFTTFSANSPSPYTGQAPSPPPVPMQVCRDVSGKVTPWGFYFKYADPTGKNYYFVGVDVVREGDGGSGPTITDVDFVSNGSYVALEYSGTLPTWTFYSR